MPSFDLSNYAINPVAVLMAMTGMATLGFGIWILLINRFDRLHRDFFVLCCLLTGWLVTESVAYSAIRPVDLVPVTRLIWCFVFFIAPATFALNMSILGYKELRERVAPALYVLAGIFLPTALTDWYFRVAGEQRLGFPTYSFDVRAELFNAVYLAIFSLTFIFIIALHYRRLKIPNQQPRERGIYRLVFVATIIGVLGVIDWLQYFRLPIPPFGFFFIFTWIALFAYAIFRYQLFQLTITVAGPTIIEALPGALFVTNTIGEIVIVNPGAQNMTGETETALLGRSIRDFLTASEETMRCALLDLEKGGCTLDGLETTLRGANDKDIPVSLSARVTRRPDGVPNGIIFIAVEISRLKEQAALMEKQKADLVKLVEEMGRTQKILLGRENRLAELKKELDQLKSRKSAGSPANNL